MPAGGPGQNNGRVSMSSSASLTSGVAGRYATALFEIARDGKALDKVEPDVAALEAALAESADLRDMIASPVYTREDQGRAIAAIAGDDGPRPDRHQHPRPDGAEPPALRRPRPASPRSRR